MTDASAGKASNATYGFYANGLDSAGASRCGKRIFEREVLLGTLLAHKNGVAHLKVDDSCVCDAWLGG